MARASVDRAAVLILACRQAQAQAQARDLAMA